MRDVSCLALDAGTEVQHVVTRALRLRLGGGQRAGVVAEDDVMDVIGQRFESFGNVAARAAPQVLQHGRRSLIG